MKRPRNWLASVARLLQFHPDVGSLILALCAWAILLGIVAVLVTSPLILGQRAFREEWEPALTYPSVILIGAESSYIRLAPGARDCMRSAPSSEIDQVLCKTLFEGATLELDVTLENDMTWRCSASYAGESAPCRASFDLKDNRTYVVVGSDLGLSAERFQQLAVESASSGWGEQEWLGLGRVLAAVLSLVALILLWRHSGKYPDDEPAPNTLFRLIYTLGISLLIFVTASYISLILLFAFGLVD